LPEVHQHLQLFGGQCTHAHVQHKFFILWIGFASHLVMDPQNDSWQQHCPNQLNFWSPPPKVGKP